MLKLRTGKSNVDLKAFNYYMKGENEALVQSRVHPRSE